MEGDELRRSFRAPPGHQLHPRPRDWAQHAQGLAERAGEPAARRAAQGVSSAGRLGRNSRPARGRRARRRRGRVGGVGGALADGGAGCRRRPRRAAAAASSAAAAWSAAWSAARRRRPAGGVLLGLGIDAGQPRKWRATFLRWLPPPARLALQDGRVALLPALFAARLPQQPMGGPVLAAPRTPGARAAPAHAEPRARGLEYFLFCFRTWPLSDGGERSLDLAPPPPAAATATAASAFIGSMVGGGAVRPALPAPGLVPPSLSAARPAGGGGRRAAAARNLAVLAVPERGARGRAAAERRADPSGTQGRRPRVPRPRGETSQRPRAARLRTAAGGGGGGGGGGALPSAHIVLMAPMYRFFDKQMQNLPDISARVISLARLVICYLSRGGRRRAPRPAASAGGAGGADGGGLAAAAAGAPAALRCRPRRRPPPRCPPRAWPWAGRAA